MAVKARTDMILGAKDAQNPAASVWMRQLASRCDAAVFCWVAREYVLVGFVVTYYKAKDVLPRHPTRS